MKCSNCGKEISEETKFCKYCGANLETKNDKKQSRTKTCNKCGALIKDGSVYCDQCGALVDETEKEENNGIRIGTIIFAFITIVIMVITGLFIYKMLQKRSSFNDGGNVEVCATSEIAKQDSSTQKTTGSTVQQSSDEATVGSSQQIATDATTDTAEQIDMSNMETEAETEEIYDENAEDYVIPSSIPDEYYVYNGHTYAFYDASRYGFNSYQEILEFCEEQGGHMAVINDGDENIFLFRLVRDNYIKTAFFGYSDEKNEGDWEWADGSKGEYENWTTYGDWDLPDNGREWNGNEDYAEFNYERNKPGIPSDGTWNDAPFMENTTVFICEWEYEIEQ